MSRQGIGMVQITISATILNCVSTGFIIYLEPGWKMILTGMHFESQSCEPQLYALWILNMLYVSGIRLGSKVSFL